MGAENRKVTRLRLKNPLKVVMGSIGSSMRYEMTTRDLSHNGFFLDFDKPGRFPFTPSSIMEVWLELSEGEKLFFNGKMARVVHPGDQSADRTGPGIAIRIVQIAPQQEQALLKFIQDKLKEEKNGSVSGEQPDPLLEEAS